MEIPPEIAQWATVATFLGAILGVARSIYLWRADARRENRAHDETVQIEADRRAKVEFTVEDLKEKVDHHGTRLDDHHLRIVQLEKGK